VIAVEPDPDNLALCRINTAGCTVDVIAAAIGSAPGLVSLTNPQWQWSVETRRDDAGRVPIVTMDELIRANPDGELFMVKIDIEGFEADLFERDTGWVEAAKVIFIEPHDWMLPTAGSSRHFQRVLGNLDFDLLVSNENLVYIRRQPSA
jgi:FkbM family methyltransferase